MRMTTNSLIHQTNIFYSISVFFFFCIVYFNPICPNHSVHMELILELDLMIVELPRSDLVILKSCLMLVSTDPTESQNLKFLINFKLIMKYRNFFL